MVLTISSAAIFCCYILAVNDDCCRENLCLMADTSISGARIYGKLASILSDNGTEFDLPGDLEIGKRKQRLGRCKAQAGPMAIR